MHPMFRLSALVLLVAVSTALASCSSPLASRRARTLRTGEAEFSAVPYIQGVAFAPQQAGLAAAPIYPFAEGTARFGLFDQADLQIKVDPTIIPEVNFAYQVVGNQNLNELAVTIGAGIKPTIFGAGAAIGGFVNVPLYVGVDLPFGEQHAFTFGTRIIPSAVFGASAGGAGTVLSLSPGGFAALHLQFGSFFIRPEFAVGSSFLLGALSNAGGASALGLTNISLSGGFGLGIVFDFDQNRAAAEQAKNAPAAAPAPEPAPAPASAPTPEPAPAFDPSASDDEPPAVSDPPPPSDPAQAAGRL